MRSRPTPQAATILPAGLGSLFSNMTGNGNTAIGENALAANATGNFNTAIGVALHQSITGNNNIAVGHFAGESHHGR
jgi:hypothetical protein